MRHTTDDDVQGDGRVDKSSQQRTYPPDQSPDSQELDAGLERLSELADLLTLLVQQQKRERLRLQTVAGIITLVNQTLDFNEVATTALGEVVKMLSSDGRTVVGTLQRVTDDRTELEDIAGLGYKEGQEDVPVEMGQGITGWVAETGKSLLIKDMRDPEWHNIYIAVMDQEILSELAVPLLRDGEVWGVLNVESPAVAAFDEDDEQLLTTVGEQILIALHNAEQANTLRRERERYQVAVEVTKAIGRTVDFHEVAKKALAEVVGFLKDEDRAVVGTLQRVTDDRTELEDIAGLGYKEGCENVPVLLGQGITGWVAETGKSLLIKDMRDPEWHNIYIAVMDQEILSELAVPLLRDGEVWGVLNVESPAVAAFDEDDEQLLTTVGEQILIALHNAEYVELQEKLHNEKSRRILAEEWGALSATAGTLLHHIGNNLGVIQPVVKEVKGVLEDKEAAFTKKEYAVLHEDLAVIGTNALSTLDLVHALRRAYTGKPPKIEPVDVNWMIEYTLRGMGLRDIELTLNLCEENLEVEADRARLVEAVSELIRNAMKAAPPEGLQLTITSRIHDNHAEVIFKDNGRGLSPDELEHAFEVFYRAQTDREGFGVGLSGIRKKMQSIGGDVLLESAGVGRGATATIRLPVVQRRMH